MRPGNRLAREAVLSAAAAAAAASLLAWLGPPGSDLAAHAYQRAVFLQHGFSLWNNFWYAGRYSFVTYSLIYYPLAALFGIRLLAVATVAAAALAFAVVLGLEWGPTARWSSRTFAVVWAGIVLSAAFPFALGAALALLTIWALQAGARWRFAALALLTLAASPVAFLLLALVLGGIGLAQTRPRRARPGADGRRRRGRRAPALAALPGRRAVPVLARRVPGRGHLLPDRRRALVERRPRTLGWITLVYLAACSAVFVVPSAVGENVARLRYAAIPFCVLVALAAALAAVAGVPRGVRARGLVERDAARRELRARRVRPGGVARVLGARDRLPAAAADALLPRRGGRHGRPLGRGLPPRAGIPVARGWFRQDDFPENSLLYGDLRPSAYVHWLRGLGVRYVVLTDAPTDYSARGEARLLRGGRSGLPVAFRSTHVTVFAVPRPRPLVTGPGRARVLRLTQTRLVVQTARGGRYRLAVRWSPYWHVSRGCLAPRQDGMLELHMPRRRGRRAQLPRERLTRDLGARRRPGRGLLLAA